MTSRETVAAFVTQAIFGNHVGAIRGWYHDDAWMGDNQALPRQGGRQVLMNQEAPVMESSVSVLTEPPSGPLLSGDDVAIHWRSSFELKDGGRMRQKAVAWRSRRADKIAEETFFYDAGQRIQKNG